MPSPIRRPLRYPAVVVLLIAAVAFPVGAQWGAAASVFTEDGIEISADARVVSLFAMLNGLGFDEESERGPAPLHLPMFTEAREKARSSLGRPGPTMKKMDDIVKENKVSVRRYANAALRLGPPPSFKPSGKVPRLTKELYEPLRAWFNEEGGAAVHRAVGSSVKGEQRALLEPLNNIAKKLNAAIRLGDEEEQLLDDVGPQGRVVVVLNPLDSHGTLHATRSGDVTFVVSGPRTKEQGDSRLIEAVAFAYAGTQVTRESAKFVKPGTLADEFSTMPKSTKKRLRNEKKFIADLLSCAFVRHVAKGSKCPTSTVVRAREAQPILSELDKRVAAHADSGKLLSESMAELLAPLAPPPAAAPAAGPDGAGVVDAGPEPSKP